MKQYVKRRLPSPTSWQLEKLAEYLITRPDLDGATPEQVELALKRARKVSANEDPLLHGYARHHEGPYRSRKTPAREQHDLVIDKLRCTTARAQRPVVASSSV
jgi:hypothetical protein